MKVELETYYRIHSFNSSSQPLPQALAVTGTVSRKKICGAAWFSRLKNRLLVKTHPLWGMGFQH